MKLLIKSLISCLLIFSEFSYSMKNLPRNMPLKTFDPHRKEFVCKYQDDVLPRIDEEAERWFQEGLALTSPSLWPNQRDYVKAAQRWQQAADRNHWEAMLNLANAYAHGEGVTRDTERAVLILEKAMQLGIPSAFDVMGTYHMHGIGVKQDVSRAYAFWQLAAEMGSPSAMAYLGRKMEALYDSPPAFWANRKIALRMLECGYHQDNGEAAFNLGADLVAENAADGRARIILQDGVKLGNHMSAIYLASAFRNGKPLSGIGIDKARAERYSLLSDALQRNPDLRFPNLDKILPLPPANLPMWNGDRNILLDAAKPVLQKPDAPPPPEPNPAWRRTGRAHIPPGRQLPVQPQIQVLPQYESTAAPETGYWIARLMRPISDRHHAWNAAQLPLRYQQGELFDRSRSGLQDEDGRIQFHYLGEPVDLPPPVTVKEDPRVTRRAARYVEFPQIERRYRSHSPCPRSGIWRPYLPDEHPLHESFNRWDRQTYVRKGMPFPDVIKQRPGIEPHELLWQWLGNANEERHGLEHVSLDSPAVEVADDR
ncbi:SEL1-like repeat protein [Herbaspirillum rubrisubalbicans]|uniref:SEL1-like repeat protein n=1 Tax=Herbaspirillum rubrisubalbicans TaxID=80842 RepID=UPI00155977C9|nr:tetratricopeptide repeat protein [Herbaspirillum rubrisubalbicans]NQE49396.1 hypothetical protein [Herbaspirillum rubrisubalbicans]